MSARPTRTPSTLNNTRSSVASSSKKELNGGWFDVQLKTISHHVAEKENAAKVKVNGKVIVVQNEAWEKILLPSSHLCNPTFSDVFLDFSLFLNEKWRKKLVLNLKMLKKSPPPPQILYFFFSSQNIHSNKLVLRLIINATIWCEITQP